MRIIMKQLMNLIQINNSFRKSVNLQLDLGDYERIGSYIPTRSSIAILQRYLEGVAGKSTENATILIGPYGKGKSHLLLVLLALLGSEKEEAAELIAKIEKIDKEAAEFIKQTTGKNRYLHVLVSGNAGEDLNQAFIFALREALVRNNLKSIAPESYYSEAMKVISKWKNNYPDTYQIFEEILEKRDFPMKDLQNSLLQQKKEGLDLFREIYPKLTAGSTFEPLLQMEALKIYQQVSRTLTEDYGYSGIFIIFDEFSKYIEGHGMEGFSADMKVLQDMCELANSMKNQQMFLTLVAHKSIHEYAKGLDRSVINAFRGVEGRIREIDFVVSAQNNYELIADTIEKKEPEFSEQFKKLEKKKQYKQMIEESKSLACFSKLFQEEEFEKILAKGCFPLTPVCAYALLRVSEKVAQNERTIFTFLADEGQGSLPWLLKKGQKDLIGVDKIYDYFKGLFRETNDQPQIHTEWLKAEYALSKAETEEEKKIIKAMAIIRIIHREEELPAQNMQLRLAVNLEETKFEDAMQVLREKKLVLYRSSLGVYAFRNNVGVDVEKEIEKEMARRMERMSVCESLRQASELEYELPKQYNQKYAITRYFQYEYMTEEDFLKLANAEYLFDDAFSDGKIILLINKDKVDHQRIQRHLDELGDVRLLVMISTHAFFQEENLCKLESVRALKTNEKFIDGNEVLVQELNLYEEDLVFEINASLEEDFLPENHNVVILQKEKLEQVGTSASQFNQIMSDICAFYYGYSPRVNHELLNIQKVEGQYLRARNAVVKNILEENNCEQYLTGTNPESMVYRAAFVHTKEDVGCEMVSEKIDQFFAACAGKKVIFSELYQELQGEGFGARKGIIPLFLAKKLSLAEGTPVIYLRNKELEVTFETLNNVNDFPEKYQLYIESETAAKDWYLTEVEDLFCEKGTFALSRQNRINGIVTCMQKWYRSLPQYTMVTEDFEEELVEKIAGLRNLLKRAEVNPRELIFDKIPQTFGTTDYKTVMILLNMIHKQMDEKINELNKQVASQTKKVFHAKEHENLRACLSEWYRRQSDASKSYILSTTVSGFMGYLDKLSTNDENEIVEDLSKIVMDMYLEDWNDTTIEAFRNELVAVKNEVEGISDSNAAENGKSQIILKDASGNEIEKFFEADTTDSTSVYLKNMIEEALEDFGDTLEMNQKVAVLVQALEKLIQ